MTTANVLGFKHIQNLDVCHLYLKKYWGESVEHNTITYLTSRGVKVSTFVRKGWYNDFTEENRGLILHLLTEGMMKLVGRPDLVCEVEGKLFFIEVKSEKDGLSTEQVLWAKNHPNFNVIVLFISYVPLSVWEDGLNQ